MNSRIYTVLTLVTLLAGCCTIEDPTDIPDDGFSVAVSAPAFIDMGGTKSELSSSGLFSWSKGDEIGIFPYKMRGSEQTPSQLALTLESGEGTSAAFSHTTGWGLSVDGETKYVSYFPFDSDNSRDVITIDYTGQEQLFNDDLGRINAYDYMYSDAVTPDSEHDALFEFHHIGALVNIRITVPEEYTNKKFFRMRLSADEKIFAESASYSVSSIVADGEPSFEKVPSYYMNLNFSRDGISSTDGVISAWLMMHPSQIAGRQISVKLYDSFSLVPTLEGTLMADENQVAGCRYTYNVQSSATGAIFPGRPKEGEQLHILILGHSFSANVFNQLPAITVAAGVKDVHYGYFYVSNCQLQQYWNSILNDTYIQFYYNCPAGKSSSSAFTKRVDDVLTQYPWDIVLFQQSIGSSWEGRYASYQPYLNNLAEHVRTVCYAAHGFEPAIGWHMFWSFNPDMSYKAPVIDNTMGGYNANVNAAQEMMADTGIKIVVPSGTAMQNARQTSLNTPASQVFTDDGYHASNGIGKYVAACAWFQYLIAPVYGIDITGNTYRPTSYSFEGDKVTDEVAAILQKCAVEAVKHPFEVTHIEE